MEQQFPQDPQFGQYDYSMPTGYDQQQTYHSQQQQQYSQQYTGQIFTPQAPPEAHYGGSSDNFDDEPPLLEELGINFDHIRQKTMSVLNPFKEPDSSALQDTDLAGPLVFCLALGGAMLLAGKVQFGYIYGIGMLGCLAMYALLSLMSLSGISPTCAVSILGYCLLPMVILSFLGIVVSLKGTVGMVLTPLTVLWCSASASKLFVTALAMDGQRLIVAYPCTLVYGVFALLTVF